MKVFLSGTKTSQAIRHRITVSPAADPDYDGKEVPASWVDNKNEPKTFTIEFRYGEAEVNDELAKYLIERKLVKKTALILPRHAA